MSKKPQEMSKFCETSRQLCLLLLIVVVRGGCNTQSHSMSNNNNEYEWVSWLHVTFGNANIQPETKKTSSQARRRPEMEISVKNSDIALLCQKGGRRVVDRRQMPQTKCILFYQPPVYSSYSCISINVYCSIFLAACVLSNEKKWKRFFSRDFLNVQTVLNLLLLIKRRVLPINFFLPIWKSLLCWKMLSVKGLKDPIKAKRTLKGTIDNCTVLDSLETRIDLSGVQRPHWTDDECSVTYYTISALNETF